MEGSASTPGHTAVVVLARRGARGAITASAPEGSDERLPALTLEALCFCVDFDRRDAPKLKGQPNRWFSRQIPQIWQHQHTKAGDPGSSADRLPSVKKRKRDQDRKWLGGGGCVELARDLCKLFVSSLCLRLTRLSVGACRAVSDFLAAWSTICDEQDTALKAMTQRERSQIDCSARARWEQSVRTLAGRVCGVDTSQHSLSSGFLIWRPQEEVLRPDGDAAEK